MNKRCFHIGIIIISLSFIGLYCLEYFTNSNSGHLSNRKLDLYETCNAKYAQNCLKLYKKLRFSFANKIYKLPPKTIPDELFNEFTQNGSMPIRDYLYINEAVPWNENEQIKEIMIKTIKNKWEREEKLRDELKKRSISREHQTIEKQEEVEETEEMEIIPKKVLDEWRNKVRKKEPLNYKNTELQNIMFEYENQLKKKKVAIYGNKIVWIEAILLELGVANITILENDNYQYEQYEVLNRMSFDEFFEKSLKESRIEQFDHAVSFSFIQSLGLGRFGDALNPNADLEAVRHLKCMLKPGGLLFLGLPITQAENGFIDFNAHRFYGSKRLELLFDGWDKIAESKLDGVHVVYVLKKKFIC
jgi:hypothetical protein